jgi:hypothetical protein
VGEISRPSANSFLDRQTVSKTADRSVTSLSGGVTNDDERKKNKQMSVFTAANGEEFGLVRMTLKGNAVDYSTRAIDLCCTKGQQIFLFSKTSRPALWSTQPLIQRVTVVLPGSKGTEREADHSPPSSVDVEN